MSITKTDLFVNVNGVKTDLINIFERLTGTKLTYNTNFVASNGQDLTDIFEPYVAGDATADRTKWIVWSVQKDLNVIFKRLYIAPNFPTQSVARLPVSQFAQIASIYESRVVVGLNGGNSYYSNNYGQTYTATNVILPSGILGVSLYKLRGIMHSSNIVCYSINAGLNWATTSSGLPTSGQNYKGCSIYENYAIIADGGGKLYVSNNSGLNWTTITIASKTFRQPSISFNSANNQYIAVCSTENDSMYYCTNFTGISSNTFTKCSTGVLYSVGVSLVGLKGIAGSFYSASGFWYTVDGGVNWTKSANFPTTQSYACGLSENGVGIANGTNASSYYVTKDYGLTWSQNTISGVDVCTIHNNNAIAFAFSPCFTYYGKITL